MAYSLFMVILNLIFFRLPGTCDKKWMDHQARCNLTMAWTITWESQQLIAA